MPAATWAVRVQVPTFTKVTTPLAATTHTEVVEEVTDLVPSPVVVTTGVKLAPRIADEGMFEIVGSEGVLEEAASVMTWVAPFDGANVRFCSDNVDPFGGAMLSVTVELGNNSRIASPEASVVSDAH